jgi:hypothetical protein
MHALHHRSRKLTLGSAAAIAVTGAAAFTGIAVTQSASASTNGQYIALCVDQAVTSVDLAGLNENGEVTNVSARADDLVKGSSDCYQLPGHRWKGDVKIHWTFLAGSPADSVCSVPESAESDVVNCSDH